MSKREQRLAIKSSYGHMNLIISYILHVINVIPILRYVSDSII